MLRAQVSQPVNACEFQVRLLLCPRSSIVYLGDINECFMRFEYGKVVYDEDDRDIDLERGRVVGASRNTSIGISTNNS